MSAYLNYEISGVNSRKQKVSVRVRALTKPSQETAEWLLKEKYPSATEVKITIPAAHKYPKEEVSPIKVSTLATTPARRTA
jgi:hypothetical protein